MEDLNLEQYLELLLGPKESGSAFDSDESRRTAWNSHTVEVMSLVDPGSRPWAWWQYTAQLPMLPGESDVAYLQRCGALGDVERQQLNL